MKPEKMFLLLKDTANEALNYLQKLESEKCFSVSQKMQLKNVTEQCRDLINDPLFATKTSTTHFLIQSQMVMDKQHVLGLVSVFAAELPSQETEKIKGLVLATQTVSFAIGIMNLNQY